MKYNYLFLILISFLFNCSFYKGTRYAIDNLPEIDNNKDIYIHYRENEFVLNDYIFRDDTIHAKYNVSTVSPDLPDEYVHGHKYKNRYYLMLNDTYDVSLLRKNDSLTIPYKEINWIMKYHRNLKKSFLISAGIIVGISLTAISAVSNFGQGQE